MQKELGFDLKERGLGIFFAMAACITLAVSLGGAHAEESEAIQLEIKYTNGDRADYNGMKIMVYQDSGKSPILEKQLDANPETITVPENHRYKIEVYANGMHADVVYVQLNKDPKKITSSIPLPGGLKFQIFYKNGHPINGATVVLKSQNNEAWRTGVTNDQGETLRYWVQSTTLQENHYVADVYLGEIFLTSYFPIKLQPGIATDQKITTAIPKVVGELITVNLFSGVKKITSVEGNYNVMLMDLQGNAVSSSKVGYMGDAHFSNLRSGTYVIKITTKDVIENTLWPQQKIHIIGDVNKFSVFRNNEDANVQENPFISCNCIAFRLDDVQDYWLADTQIDLINMFAEKNIPLTIGVIGNFTGSDQKLTSVIKENVGKNNIEIANHSWNNDVLAGMSEALQEKYIADANERIFQTYGKTPKIFIPPENLYDEHTIKILKDAGFTHLVSHANDHMQTYADGGFYIIPATAETGKLADRTDWQLHDKNLMKEKIIESVSQSGYAIIMMHPQEFSLNDIGEYGGPNKKSLSELNSMLDEIMRLDLKIIRISEIGPSGEKIEENAMQSESGIDTCNCVAFRLDGIQDYWLNEVQIKIMSTFVEKKAPLTIGIISNAFGNDKRITDFVKQNTGENGASLEVATKGVGLTPYTNYDKAEQDDNLKKSIESIQSAIDVRPHVFIPPDNKFNKDTLKILEENQITHISGSLINGDSPPFEFREKDFYRFPQIASTGKFNPVTNIFDGLASKQVIAESIRGIENYGFAVISIQPQEFATVINSTYVNTYNEKQIDELKNIIDGLNEKGYRIVPVGKIDSNLIVPIPSWIKNNAGWWANGEITDETFAQGMEYLMQEKIIKVSVRPQTTSAEKNIPSWIKNNAGWWAEGMITEDEFLKGIEYLVEKRILNVN